MPQEQDGILNSAREERLTGKISSLEVMTVNYKIVDGLWGSIPHLITINERSLIPGRTSVREVEIKPLEAVR